MGFTTEEDSPLVPVWLELPSLLANFFNEPMLFSLAGCIGEPLKVDRDSLYATLAHLPLRSMSKWTSPRSPLIVYGLVLVALVASSRR